ncbi:MAG: hypothetical protein ACKPKO_40145 [Candidatus Fonsibacter sp.]
MQINVEYWGDEKTAIELAKDTRKAYGAEFSEKVKVGTSKLSGPTECLVNT